MSNLYLRTRCTPQALHVTLVGPVTAKTAPRLRAELSPHAGEHVELQLRDCTSIDVDGLFALVLAHQASAEAGGSLHLVNVPPLIEHYLHDHHAGHLLNSPGDTTAPA